MNFLPIEGKISPKVMTRARGSINSQKAKQLVLHLWMYQQSVRKKYWKAKESNVTRERPPRTSPDYSSSSDSSLSETSAFLLHHAAVLALRFVFVLCKYVFPFFFCPLLTTAKTCASLNPRCGTCSLVCFCFGERRHFSFVLPIVDHG